MLSHHGEALLAFYGSSVSFHTGTYPLTSLASSTLSFLPFSNTKEKLF